MLSFNSTLMILKGNRDGSLFLFFWEFLSLAVGEGFFNFSGTRSTHSACVGPYIHPSPVSMPDATREARRPMGSRFPGLTLALNGLRQWSRKCFRCKSVVILHKYFCFIICSKWVHPKRALNITIYCALIVGTTTYCYNSGFSISGSSNAALCLSAICCAVWCGMPSCCVVCTGAVSAMPYAAFATNIRFAFVPG